MGALKACTSLVNGQSANRAIPISAWIWKDSGARVIASPSGCRMKIDRNQTETVSR